MIKLEGKPEDGVTVSVEFDAETTWPEIMGRMFGFLNAAGYSVSEDHWLEYWREVCNE